MTGVVVVPVLGPDGRNQLSIGARAFGQFILDSVRIIDAESDPTAATVDQCDLAAVVFAFAVFN